MYLLLLLCMTYLTMLEKVSESVSPMKGEKPDKRM